MVDVTWSFWPNTAMLSVINTRGGVAAVCVRVNWFMLCQHSAVTKLVTPVFSPIILPHATAGHVIHVSRDLQHPLLARVYGSTASHCCHLMERADCIFTVHSRRQRDRFVCCFSSTFLYVCKFLTNALTVDLLPFGDRLKRLFFFLAACI